MKKFLAPLFLLFAVVAAVVLNSPEQTSAAVQVPEALNLLIDGLILGAVLLGLQVFFEWTGLDLRGIGTALAASLSGFAIAELQGYINTIPVQYDQLVTIVLNVLVVILSGLGTLRLLLHRERAAVLFR